MNNDQWKIFAKISIIFFGGLIFTFLPLYIWDPYKQIESHYIIFRPIIGFLFGGLILKITQKTNPKIIKIIATLLWAGSIIGGLLLLLLSALYSTGRPMAGLGIFIFFFLEIVILCILACIIYVSKKFSTYKK